MYHYLFTNDLRISTLNESLKRAGHCFMTNSVPSAQENKNDNNNMKTLGFYFNLTESSNCAVACANGDIRKVVLNFIKKFQFPNPRTSESLNDSINDGIVVAPMRVVLQVLYNMQMLYPTAAYLTREEIKDFIFYNGNVAKNKYFNVIELIEEIVKYRRTSSYPDSIEKNPDNRQWKQEDRQIREMTKILTWSGCVSEDENQNLYIHHDNLTLQNKAALFDILTYNKFWKPHTTKNYAENRKDYETYMDVESTSEENAGDDFDVESNLGFDDIFNHSVYGMHIKLQNDALSDDNPHVCIGWSGMGDLSDITTKDELALKYDATWADVKPRKKGQDIGQVWRFIKEMQVGDYVVFSNGDTCHIGRVTSDYYFDNSPNENQDPDYLNIRDVEWLKKDVRKSDLSQALQNSLGAAMSVFGLNDYKSAIHELLKGTYVKDLVDEEGIDVIAEDVEQSYSVEELGKILSEMYNSSENKTTAIHMFGLKYAEVIMNSSASVVDIVKKSSVSDSYHTEVSKGIRIYESILKNEYGIHFAEEVAVAKAEESVQKVLPQLDKRTRKTFELNSILYGAPGTGKTYATAKYALAITEGKPLEYYKDVPREDIMSRYNQLVKDGQVVFTTFHQNYGYEDFIQGIRPDTSTQEMRFKTVDGVFKKIAEKAMDEPEKDFVIIIDEINRANISKVFGELITLIEDDKRWGEENAVSVTLPSGEIFAVPNNLYIVGTMNSADKSISLIDTALRRRFDFVEFVPDLTLISDAKLNAVLKKLNEGIEKELNSTDLLVGHSYFINKNADDICNIMNRNIIPLLYEYFFDNKNKVEAQLKSALEGLDVEIVSNAMGRIKIKKKEV